MSLTLAIESPDQPEVRALLAASDAYHAALYPAESNHLLDIAALTAGGARFFVARLDGAVVGIGSVVPTAEGWGEIKRMFVADTARGLKLGRRILARLEDEARTLGLDRLRLETGIASRKRSASTAPPATAKSPPSRPTSRTRSACSSRSGWTTRARSFASAARAGRWRRR